MAWGLGDDIRGLLDEVDALKRLVQDQAAWRHQHAGEYDGRHRGSGFAACDHVACREAQRVLPGGAAS